MLSAKKKALGAFAIATAFVAAVILYPFAFEMATSREPPLDAGIPPAFAGNRAAFSFALFSLFSMSSLAIRKLIVILCKLRSENWREDPDVGLYRMALASLMAMIICGAGPDVVLLLLYGEAGPDFINRLEVFDRVADGVALGPFLLSILFMVRAEQLDRMPTASMASLLEKLEVARPRTRNLFLVLPRGDDFRDNARIVIGVLIIAAGLGLWK